MDPFDDIPKNVWKWLNREAPPFLLIITPHTFGQKMHFDDDPEAVEAVSRAYEQFSRKRAEKRRKEKQK